VGLHTSIVLLPANWQTSVFSSQMNIIQIKFFAMFQRQNKIRLGECCNIFHFVLSQISDFLCWVSGPELSRRHAIVTQQNWVCTQHWVLLHVCTYKFPFSVTDHAIVLKKDSRSHSILFGSLTVPFNDQLAIIPYVPSANIEPIPTRQRSSIVQARNWQPWPRSHRIRIDSHIEWSNIYYHLMWTHQ